MSTLAESWDSMIISSREGRDYKKYYENDERARQYDSSRLIWEDAENRVNLLNPDPSWSVLEIGPGPGVMTIPLARRVRSVTAIEPSSSMIRLLNGHVTENNLGNVTIIHKEWESVTRVDVGTFDLVLASYCLDMTDITSCLQKMCSSAIRAVHLWWFMGQTYWEKVQNELNQEKPRIMPKADILINILQELGYQPDLEVLHGTSFPNRYEKAEDAYNRMKGILNIHQSEPLPDNARDYIEQNWKHPDGGYEYVDSTTYVHITVPMSSGE